MLWLQKQNIYIYQTVNELNPQHYIVVLLLLLCPSFIQMVPNIYLETIQTYGFCLAPKDHKVYIYIYN